MSAWIPASEARPEDGQSTVCYEPRKGNIFVSQYCVPDPECELRSGWTEEYYDKSPTTDGCRGGFGYWPFITHWMPLPEPPK